jgi:hypothetical protein
LFERDLHHPEILSSAGQDHGRYLWRDNHTSPTRIGPLNIPEVGWKVFARGANPQHSNVAGMVLPELACSKSPNRLIRGRWKTGSRIGG